ncbi:MAG: ATP-dependent helicase [Candidatus Phytoplasma stylosanthis]|uniref:ATP-dependent helicase n=1 Tax=Candidatus Phytoplasma stylosanthis TaxID=2798314 RepID=UPI002939BE95|nr:ATP-dependent helicase [Candidatus Phytoplasma stylosanthis]MDV3167766.1 ATP-dependent helicase [Candidatus Phytoplasma stylosanthis]MDV3170957.1 ATP-dependent helicase [Candidatus Phytoplasma stylosanthis]MDV3173634.1 ATP-dependent helicase [Candidatus Phytoplasma stylosanthis]MDV3174129.1 ATP-dependent helicase [Candidatus Phytoplasma stylosanthis]MDV3202352.1 ATP-dependent helicase [Candidatus Phytoplasma stylosanthis]
MKTKWLHNLNKKQLKAVLSEEKAIYLHSGAGTGKTTTLTNRIIYLLNELNINPANILAITFTNNAAKEMKERLQEKFTQDIFGHLTISTFHSLGFKILKKYINKLNLDFNNFFHIIDEKEGIKIIKSSIKELGLDRDKYKPNKLKKIFSRFKNEKIKKQILNELDEVIQNDKWFIDSQKYNLDLYSHEEKKIFNLYELFLKKNNFLDFDDLIIYTYRLLKNNSSVASFYKKKFTHILIDEFQDIDLIQYQIIKIIGQNNFIFAVGDPNQNIYSFRGANILCNELFLRDFKSRILCLDYNYRSTKNILDKANLLISYNYDQKGSHFKNTLKNDSSYGKEVIYNKFTSEYEEAEFISNQIKELVFQQNYNYSDIAILYRVNKLYKHIQDSFIIKNIPYFIKNDFSLHQKKEIKDFISYLRLLVFPGSDIDLKRIINTPPRQIGKQTIKKLEIIAHEKKVSLFEAMNYLSEKDKIKNKINNFQNIFQNLQNLVSDKKKCSLDNIIFLIDKEIKYSEILSKKKKQIIDNDSKTQNDILNKLDNLQKIFIEENKEQKEGTFWEKLNILLNKITLLEDNNQQNNKNKVLMSTIHKAKGLEFKVVFVIGFEREFFIQDKNTNSINKEERRIAYVAITRAKEILYITSSNVRFLNGKEIFLKPVVFLREMELSSLNNNFNEKREKNKNISIYKAGEKIKHNIFGKGLIVAVDKSILIISFGQKYGIKKIAINHFSLSKE